MQAAIDYLTIQVEILETNAPINQREGHFAQAALERDHAAQIRDALTFLINAGQLQLKPRETQAPPCTGS